MTEDAFKHWFGERVRAARKAQGLSQAELASKLPGTTESGQVGGWERGKVFPEVRNIVAILTALEMTPEALFCSVTRQS